jgi:glucokinase
MATQPAYSIGVDLGGTNLRAAAIGRDGKLLCKVGGKTNLREGRDAVIEDIVFGIRALRDQFGHESLAGVGVAVPGFIEIERGLIVGSHNLPQFDGFPVREDISNKLGTPVILKTTPTRRRRARSGSAQGVTSTIWCC